MNLNELQRVTILSLPDSKERDIQKIISRYNNTLQTLLKRDEDKEKRLRALIDRTGRSNGVKRDIIRVTADYNVVDFFNDMIIISDSAVNTTIRFPKATGSGGNLVVKNFGAGTVTADGYGTDTIDENPTQAVLPNEGIIFFDYLMGAWLVT